MICKDVLLILASLEVLSRNLHFRILCLCGDSMPQIDEEENMAKKERKYIKIRGASEHNLKSVSIDIPRDEFVVLTG